MANFKLLLADDSATIRRLIQMMFAAEPVEVVMVRDGEKAIEMIPDERPDIILVDIALPNRSGYEVASFVQGRADLAHIPVLLLAAAFETVDDRQARQCGSDGVLAMPFESSKVVARVMELLSSVKKSEAPPVKADAPRAAGQGAGPSPLELSPPNEPAMVDMDDRGAEVLDPLGEEFDEVDETSWRRDGEMSSDELDAKGRHERSAAPRSEGHPVERDLEWLDSALRGMSSAPSRVELDTDDTGLPTPTLVGLLGETRGSAPAAAVVSEALVAEVTRRVIERLSRDAGLDTQDLVARVVSEVANRLVHEEIQRVRGRQS
ncbi:MAG: response regulator [Vicinamibacterales bacterium]